MIFFCATKMLFVSSFHNMLLTDAILSSNSSPHRLGTVDLVRYCRNFIADYLRHMLLHLATTEQVLARIATQGTIPGWKKQGRQEWLQELQVTRWQQL